MLNLYLVAPEDDWRNTQRLVIASSYQEAAQAMSEDGDDGWPGRTLCVWKLGKFPERYINGKQLAGRESVL